MGNLEYIGWSVLLASAILFGTILGIFSRRMAKHQRTTRWLLFPRVGAADCQFGRNLRPERISEMK